MVSCRSWFGLIGGYSLFPIAILILGLGNDWFLIDYLRALAFLSAILLACFIRAVFKHEELVNPRPGNIRNFVRKNFFALSNAPKLFLQQRQRDQIKD